MSLNITNYSIGLIIFSAEAPKQNITIVEDLSPDEDIPGNALSFMEFASEESRFSTKRMFATNVSQK